MVKSRVTTVEEYLQSLPVERRAAISKVRDVILKNLPKGYIESMTWGYPTYEIPLERYPNTYNKQPLGIAALASQKNYMSLYLMSVYGDKATEEWFHQRYKASGKKLDMEKSCVRFKKADDLPLDLIAEVIGRVSVDQYIQWYERLRNKK
ncbi:MAG TPA: DUF1801 domain-containing protein [Anaerolineales bacterium]|jgi:uncharacterized protein YdhG (YjbR/CyaY superfamily)|nr:DUF1801 domain-containing protein [Anaerolineales bacterium]